jgi:hypothetical protein
MAELGSTNIYGDLNVQNNNIKQVGKINDVTDVELANLKGSTSNIQAQLNGKASNTISITAGNGLSGGGTLSATRTITLGTPSTITSATTNSVTATSHTHALTLTKADVGLGSVLNYGISTEAEAQAGTSNAKYMTPLRTKQAIDNTNTIHVGSSAPSSIKIGWVDTSL